MTLLADYGAAWEANDGAAVLALMTTNAIVKSGDGVARNVDWIKDVVDGAETFTGERIGDPIIAERPTGWMVADAASINYAGMSYNELGLFLIEERGGQLLIAYHETWRAGQ